MTIDAIIPEEGALARPSFRAFVRRGWLGFHAWSVRRRTRRALADMTDAQLCDIGLTRSEARQEVAKSFYWE